MVRLSDFNVLLTKKESETVEFYECIEDLLQTEEVQKLSLFSQHMNTSRLQHSINVAYYSYTWCKKLGLNYKSAARAGVLHDLYLYDWRDGRQPEGSHVKAHPIVALRNAKKLAEINAIEEDAILRHMWPCTIKPPKYKESMVVSMADKYSAYKEVKAQLRLRIIAIKETLT